MVVFYPKKNLFDFGANGSVDIRLCLSSLADTRMNEYDLVQDAEFDEPDLLGLRQIFAILIEGLI
jgi:hypothetical protein